jgi:uncharacterized protein (DUF427 family)
VSRPDSDLEREVRRWRRAKRERPSGIEVPRPGQESVWDYPRPPRLEPIASRIRVEFAGVVLAESCAAYRVLETAGAPVYYLPPADVRTELLASSDRTTLCEWKGRARFWSVRARGRFALDAAWDYPDPFAGYEVIRGHLAFFAQKMDACYVGAERARPQPGGFYGGWITPDVVGPFKGEPGSERW